MQDAKSGKPVDVKLRLNIKMTNEIFRMVLGCRFSGSIPGVVQGDEDIVGREFKDIIDELQQLKGLFILGDFVPWLRFFDIGGIEKRMEAVQERLDMFLNKVVDEHEAKRRKGKIAETDKDMVDVLLRTMHEQDQKQTLKLDVDSIKATVMVREINHHQASITLVSCYLKNVKRRWIALPSNLCIDFLDHCGPIVETEHDSRGCGHLLPHGGMEHGGAHPQPRHHAKAYRGA